MEMQWPLIVFTLFIALSSGILGMQSFLLIRSKGAELQKVSVIVAAASLVIGGVASFLHLQHWERIFNGFGHITSGITLEMIGCVVMAIVIFAWLFLLFRGKTVPKALAWITMIVAVAMVVVTADSYIMPARPAWGYALIAFYLTNALLLGTVAMWVISTLKGDKEAAAITTRSTFVAAIIQLVGIAVYTIAIASSKIANYGYYLDPTKMTTNPVHVDSLINVMLFGSGAVLFWSSVACAIVIFAVAVIAKGKNAADGKPGKAAAFVIPALIAAPVLSVALRALIYIMAYPTVLLY